MSRAELIADQVLALPRPLLLCFDLDGTLSPIVEDPTEARVPDQVQRDLRRLAGTRGVHVAFLTGRDASAARRMLRVPGAHRGFEHGRLLVPPGKPVRIPQPKGAQRAKLAAFEAWAKAHAVPRGGDLEHKRQSRVLHTRRLAQRNPKAARQLLAAAAQKAGAIGLHARPGRWVMEAELDAGDKGIALEKLVRRTRARGVVYAGDDTTDVPALRAASRWGGLGIFVRSQERPRRPKGVATVVAGPDEIAKLVDLLARQLA